MDANAELYRLDQRPMAVRGVDQVGVDWRTDTAQGRTEAEEVAEAAPPAADDAVTVFYDAQAGAVTDADDTYRTIATARVDADDASSQVRLPVDLRWFPSRVVEGGGIDLLLRCWLCCNWRLFWTLWRHKSIANNF